MSSYAKYNSLGGDKKPKFQEDSSVCQTIKTMDQKNKMINSNALCIVDVYADWCGPCKQVAPLFQDLAKKYGRNGLCAFARENVDDKLTEGIRGIPVFFFYKNGVLVDSVTGADINAIENKVVQLL